MSSGYLLSFRISTALREGVQVICFDIDTRIKTIRKAAEELKELSGGIPAVDRNAVRILASAKMLESNISDILDLPSATHK